MMKIKLIALIGLLLSLTISYSQNVLLREDVAMRQALAVHNDEINRRIIGNYQKVKPIFERIYGQYPTIPRGFLEAVAYRYSLFSPLMENENMNMPAMYGLMGCVKDGKGFFRPNLNLWAQLSGFPDSAIMRDDEVNVAAYAKSFAIIAARHSLFGKPIENYYSVLLELCELPEQLCRNRDYAANSFLYAVYHFLSDTDMAAAFSFSPYTVDFEGLFGQALPTLRSPYIVINENDVYDNDNHSDYVHALWLPAGECNFDTGRGRDSVSQITIHYTQGTYWGTIAWFRNCVYNGVGARSSAHYVIRSFDGQIAQMVHESDRAWHARSANPYTIGIEHEAYGNIQDFFTSPLYTQSAHLVADICRRYAINPLSVFYTDTLDDGTVLNEGCHDLGGKNSCIKIKGHQHFPDQTHTDPGCFWNWNLYYKLINVETPVSFYHGHSGTLSYMPPDDNPNVRKIYCIEVNDADSVSLLFNTLNLEENHEFLYIYDGNSPFAPLIGRWNTTTPDRIVSSGNALCIEYRANCAAQLHPWQAEWHTFNNDIISKPVTHILHDENEWLTEDRTLCFVDSSVSPLAIAFFQLLEKNGNNWEGLSSNGFAHYSSSCSDTVNLFPLNGNSDVSFLYSFIVSTQGEDGMCSFYFHLNHSFTQSRLSGYKLFFDSDSRTVTLFKIFNDASTVIGRINNVDIASWVNKPLKVIYERSRGSVSLFANDLFVFSFVDAVPLASASNFFGWQHPQSVAIDNIDVFKSRGACIDLALGHRGENSLMVQACAGIPQTMINTVIIDSLNNISAIDSRLLKVDFSKPVAPDEVLDGTSADVDSVLPDRPVAAHWHPACDEHSGVKEYRYQIRIVPGSLSRQWISNGSQMSFTLPVMYVSGFRYNVAVYAVNGAGLASDVTCSDGAICLPKLYSGTAPFSDGLCPRTKENVRFIQQQKMLSVFVENYTESDAQIKYGIYSLQGTMIRTGIGNRTFTLDFSPYPPGMYVVYISSNGKVISTKKVTIL